MNINNITFSLLEKIEKANKDFHLFDGAEKILVGFSGGADSTCLVTALKEMSEKYGFTLYALHVNHMIRGEEADKDEEFARNLCKKLGIEFICERVDVPALALEKGESIELCARNVRYDLFAKICKNFGISHVATAHNACDNTETVLLNLVRGTGTRGLCGIPPKRMLCDGVMVIRPLIYTERKHIEAFLSEKSQDFVTDSTNLDSDYTRNFLRNDILPLLRNINPSLEESFARTSRLHMNDEDYLSSEAEKFVTDDIELLSGLHESVLSRVVIKLFSRVSDETPSELHVRTLCEKIYSCGTNTTSVSFPGCITAKLEKGKLRFEKDDRERHKTCEFEYPLCEGAIFFEENPYALYISFDENKDIPQTLENEENIYKKYTTDYLYFDTIPHVLRVRNRREGDKIYSGKMHKSIKRLMNNSPYTQRERFLLPFVCDNGEVILVPGVSMHDKCRKASDKKRCITVALYSLSSLT